MTTDKQSTALQQLIKWMDDNKSHCTYGTIRGKATELLEVERKQIEDAYNQDLYGGLEGFQKFTDGSDYFTTTFKQ